ncbi:MAG: Coenzyme F420 hydrogenase/dehydrogenase, beta subunit C-terminal domain, partial [Opitutales bacterium]|nr:Coenzyme F420 hydrogenase/dehydrogenase, beta subunit C-terminal domain [Opitutales bacterium]
IGEMADISCGDAWYLTPDKKPDFTEAEGRNVIFARTDIGKNLLDAIIKDGGLQVTPTTVDDLKYIQTYQWDRRATMVDKMLVMRLCVDKFVANIFLSNYEKSKNSRKKSIERKNLKRSKTLPIPN